jgi:hypothetical protein
MVSENILQTVSRLSCVDPSQGAKTGRFIDNTLNKAEIEHFLKHLDKCEKCSKLVFLSEYFDMSVENNPIYVENNLAANGG